MDCVQAREAMSAQFDGEPTGAAEALVEGHVRRCPECQAWREAAYDVTRRIRMTGWTPAGDLTDVVLATTGRRTFSWVRRTRAVLLVVAAAGQLVLTVPLLAAAGMDLHRVHELGAFDFALAVAFAVGALRPRLAAGLAWPCSAAAAGLLATSAVDVIAHHTFEVHELRHLIAVAGAVLLCWTAREAHRREPDNALAEPVNIGGPRRVWPAASADGDAA